MEFTADRKILLKALGHAKGVTEKRTLIPILGNVLLSVQGDLLAITGTDMEIAVVESIPVSGVSDGSCTVPVDTIYDMVNKLPDGAQPHFTHAGGEEQLKIRSGRFSTSLTVLPVEDFPMMTAGDLPTKFSIPGDSLGRLLHRARFAMSNEETRYYLNGICLHIAGDNGSRTLRAVATDGHRLAQVNEAMPDGADSMPKIIVPRKTVIAAIDMFKDVDDNIDVAMSDTRVQFSAGGLTLTSKLVDGVFPEYDRVIPSGNKNIMLVGKEDFAKSLARVSVISKDRSPPVKLHLDQGTLTLSASNAELGSAVEMFGVGDITYDAGQLEIGFNAKYLADILGNVSDIAEFRFGDSSTPAMVVEAGKSGDALYVIMPMRV